MTRLKLIGGTRNGQFWDVVNPYFGDTVRVPLPQKPVTISAIVDYEFPPSSIRIDYEYYIVDVFNFTEGKHSPTTRIYFLRHEKFPDMYRAIEHVLTRPNESRLKFFDPITQKMRNATQEDLDTINEIHMSANRKRK